MKKFILLILTISFIFGMYTINSRKSSKMQGAYTMQLTSSAFIHNAKIPSKYTCKGEGINPPLHISGVPQNAKSLALIVDDPDAPMGTWVHWVVYNITPTLTDIREHAVPQDGIEGNTSFGKPGYGGPCPPSGTHRYFFKLYALDKQLQFALETKVDKQLLEKEMQGNIIDKTELIGLFTKE